MTNTIKYEYMDKKNDWMNGPVTLPEQVVDLTDLSFEPLWGIYFGPEIGGLFPSNELFWIYLEACWDELEEVIKDKFRKEAEIRGII